MAPTFVMRDSLTMRIRFSLLLGLAAGFLFLTGCAGRSYDSIDPKATAVAPWKPGEEIYRYELYFSNISRQFIGITTEGYLLAQDFYIPMDSVATPPKYSDPVAFTDRAALTELALFPDMPTPCPIEGKLNLWHPNGQPLLASQYHAALLQGPWTRWDSQSQGVKIAQGNYEAGQMDGLWTSWYDASQKLQEGHFRNGMMQGLWIHWYANGQKSQEINYLNGKEDGPAKFWESTGQQSVDAHFRDGQRDGQWTWWYIGLPPQKSERASFQNGHRQGHWIAWYPNGALKEEGQYEDGKRQGVWTYYPYEAGLPACKIMYDHDDAQPPSDCP